MASTILQSQQSFSLPSDTGVRWNANAATSLPGATQSSSGAKQHARGVIQRGPAEPPRSYDAATGGKSEIDYGAVYGN
jgi:hypothetical protein